MKQSKNHCISVTHKRIKKGIVRFKWSGKGLSQNDLHILLQFINGKIRIFIQICLTLFTNGFLCLMKGLTRDILMSDNVDLWNMLYLWLVVGIIRKLRWGAPCFSDPRNSKDADGKSKTTIFLLRSSNKY